MLETASSYRFMWQGEETLSKLINTSNIYTKHTAQKRSEVPWEALQQQQQQNSLHRSHPSRLHSSLGVFVGLVFLLSLCAYSISIQAYKIFLQHSTPCSTHAPTNMLINTYDTDLHSRTQPLLGLANEANYRFLTGAGRQFCTTLCLELMQELLWKSIEPTLLAEGMLETSPYKQQPCYSNYAHRASCSPGPEEENKDREHPLQSCWNHFSAAGHLRRAAVRSLIVDILELHHAK